VLRPIEGAREPVAVVASYRGADHYVPVFIGMDYRFVRSAALYRQSLRQVLLRARALGCKRVEFGIGATLEKQRLGARSQPASLFADAGFARMLGSVESET